MLQGINPTYPVANPQGLLLSSLHGLKLGFFSYFLNCEKEKKLKDRIKAIYFERQFSKMIFEDDQGEFIYHNTQYHD